MKKGKVFLEMGISILIVCSIVIMYLFFIKTESIEIVWMPVPDVQEQIDVFVEMGYCTNGYASEDGLGAIIQLTEWQRIQWKKYLYDDIHRIIEQVNELETINMCVSEDTKEVSIYIDEKVSYETLATYLGVIVWDIESIQILNDVEEWGFVCKVKDIKTEKELIQINFPEEDIKIDGSLWDEIEETAYDEQ